MKCYKVEKQGKAEVIDIEPKLGEYYRHIGCDCIDIACLTVGGVPFDFIVDDVGLLKADPIVTVIEHWALAARLVGTVLVFGCGEHDIRGLTDDEVRILRGATFGILNDGGRQILMVD